MLVDAYGVELALGNKFLVGLADFRPDIKRRLSGLL